MKLVVQVRLFPGASDAEALRETLALCNEAANHVSRRGFEAGVTGKQSLQRLTYGDLKDMGLSAQPAINAARKVSGAYAALKANIRAGNYGEPGSPRRTAAEGKPVVFRPDAAQPFDDRCLSWQYGTAAVSIWTTAGRLKNIPFTCSPAGRKLLEQHRQGESDLAYRNGMWFLYATCEVPEPPVTEPAGWLGVDLGIVNIATDSDGRISAGRQLNRHRERQVLLRRKLQAKGTQSARRVLKRRRRKETRMARDINHVISKSIVTEAQRTSRGIALEELMGIRERVRLRKSQRVTLHSWSFAQLGQFIAYKARRAGVPVMFVDPAYTSRMCADCGYTDKKNRVSQARFICRSCGVVAHADRNASRNIGARARGLRDSGALSPAPAPA